MIKKLNSYCIPEVEQINYSGFFDEAHVQRSGLAEVILERDMRRMHERIDVIHIIKLMDWMDMDSLNGLLHKEGYSPATLCQILQIACVDRFQSFEPIYALGSISERGFVPSLFLPKLLSSAKESENAIPPNHEKLAERIEIARGGRHISGNFLSRHNSKNSHFAVISI